MNERDTTLQSLRTEIDKIDTQLLHLIARRMDVVREVGAYKKTNKLKLLNPKRKSDVQTMWLKDANKLRLSTDFLHTMYLLIHEYAIKIESEINIDE